MLLSFTIISWLGTPQILSKAELRLIRVMLILIRTMLINLVKSRPLNTIAGFKLGPTLGYVDPSVPVIGNNPKQHDCFNYIYLRLIG